MILIGEIVGVIGYWTQNAQYQVLRQRHRHLSVKSNTNCFLKCCCLLWPCPFRKSRLTLTLTLEDFSEMTQKLLDFPRIICSTHISHD